MKPRHRGACAPAELGVKGEEMSTLAAPHEAAPFGVVMTPRPSARSIARRARSPLRAFLDRALLADLPASMRGLRIDTDARPGVRKTLLAFSADRSEIGLFCALSPGLYREEPVDLRALADHRSEMRCDAALPAAGICHEPDFPWWTPPDDGPGRRYAYTTPQLDFVEVIVDGMRDRVFIRAIH
jgi:hypothetical protein